MYSLCTAVTNSLLCNLSVYMSNLSVSCRLSAACCLHTATRLTTSQGARLPDCQVNSTNSPLFAHSCMHTCHPLPPPQTKALHFFSNSKLLIAWGALVVSAVTIPTWVTAFMNLLPCKNMEKRKGWILQLSFEIFMQFLSDAKIVMNLFFFFLLKRFT